MTVRVHHVIDDRTCDYFTLITSLSCGFHVHVKVHQCFEYEQKKPFLFNDMQMASDILNFLLVDHRVSCTQSFD